MTVNYWMKNGRCHYGTDRSKPHPRGKYIGGWQRSLEDVRNSVARYLGSADFVLLERRTRHDA